MGALFSANRDRRDCHIPPHCPFLAFLRFQRTEPMLPLTIYRVSFTPETLLSFRLQGFEPLRDPETSPFPLPPLPLDTKLCRCSRLRRLQPSEKLDRLRIPQSIRCPLDVFPSGALLPSKVESASRLILSHAWKLPDRSPVVAGTSEYCQLANQLRTLHSKAHQSHQPLWGFSPRRTLRRSKPLPSIVL